jgi:hypothetical protein
MRKWKQILKHKTRTLEKENVIDCSMVYALILCSAGRRSVRGVGNYLRPGAVSDVRRSSSPAGSDQISQIHLTALYKQWSNHTAVLPIISNFCLFIKLDFPWRSLQPLLKNALFPLRSPFDFGGRHRKTLAVSEHSTLALYMCPGF